MNLEKFNAETTPLGTPLITREGIDVTEWYCFKDEDLTYVLYANIGGKIERFTREGRFDVDIKGHDLDLFIKPKIESIWVNVFKGRSGWYLSGYFTDEAAAKEDVQIRCEPNYLKTIQITDEI